MPDAVCDGILGGGWVKAYGMKLVVRAWGEVFEVPVGGLEYAYFAGRFGEASQEAGEKSGIGGDVNFDRPG